MMNDRYAILGDIHANLEALSAVVHHAQKQECTRLVSVGDIVGYNANPKECLRIVRDLGIACVKGNHDDYCSSDMPLLNLSPRATAAVAWTRQELNEAEKRWLNDLKYTRYVNGFTLVHASLDSPNKWTYIQDTLSAASSFSYQNTSICFFGHTHVPALYIRNNEGVSCCAFADFTPASGHKYFVNVGSVGEPRDGNPMAAYAVCDLSQNRVKLHRVSYDVELTRYKLAAAGLPMRALR